MPTRLKFAMALTLLVVGLGCGRPRQPATAPVSALPDASALQVKTQAASASPAQPSEHIASNKPEPGCKDCQKGDATNGPLYYGKPDMPLDEKTLAEVSDSVDATCGILEDGLSILEKHVKSPDQATADLEGYRAKNAQKIKRTFEKAREIKARLKAAGYDQDIPAEVRPHFDERMTKIHTRLEAMRDVYRQHGTVLEAFGQFFPRGP